jgi:hypothetical protein
MDRKYNVIKPRPGATNSKIPLVTATVTCSNAALLGNTRKREKKEKSQQIPTCLKKLRPEGAAQELRAR